MKVSINSIRRINNTYKTTDDVAAIGIDALAAKVGAQLGAIEEIEQIGRKYQGIVVAKIVHLRKHENSDHLNVCLIDDAGKTKAVARDKDGLVQVVCGADNLYEGMLVPWLPPGTVVPESVDKDPFVLEAREMRGETSNGMLASARELGLGDDHSGILEIRDVFDRVRVGDDFAEAFQLKDDVIFNIENKMFTHRPDCFGLLGVSRELAGIQGMAFRSPDWYTLTPPIPEPEAEPLPLTVTNEIPELVPRFTAITLRGVQVGPSPTWVVVELAKVGLRSINNVVDYTNFFMLETGQPLHAYDYDKVRALTSGDAAEITVRYPRSGEKVSLLNGKTIEPREEAMMIASGDHLIGIGGVMGGADTEVDETTKNIIIECATFDMYSIRRTAMAHGLFTDAVTRFNKGQSPLQNRAVLAKIVDEIRQFAGGKVASQLVDNSQLADRQWVHPPIPVTTQFVNERLGLELTAAEMKTILENVECSVAVNGDALTVTAPFWRTDIEIREDVVEEVGRLYGFDKLPLELPQRSIKPAVKDALFELKSAVRARLAKAGANEVLTYSFVHGDLLKKVGQDTKEAFQVGNALSPDLQYYRLSLTPSLLDKVHLNIKAGYGEFVLFELGKAHNLQHATTDEGLPMEFEMLDLVYARSDKLQKPGAAFYEARAFLTDLAGSLGVALEFRPFETEETYQVVKPYDHTRSAKVFVRGSDIALGMIGEYKASVRRALKLPAHAAGFGVGLMQLQQAIATAGKAYTPLPRFPKVMQDVTLKAPATLPYAQMFDVLQTELTKQQSDHMLAHLEPLDIYQRAEDADHKQFSFRLTIANYERTLTDAEVAKLLDGLAAAAQKMFSAERI
ncbi:MAG TPA: phenylalanine--tRNA ligase subunit beta [Candidatus Saccharimonadales bacterium]|nr:phenylalanine--tRNA ligase subunit beta [Candidatus Saccharimonadales bacterium]